MRVPRAVPVLALALVCAGCGGVDVRTVPDRTLVRLSADEAAGGEFSYPTLVAQGPQDLPDPRPLILSSAAKLEKTKDGGVRLVCGQPDDRAKRVEIDLMLKDGQVVLSFPASAPWVPWVRADGTVQLVERDRIKYLPKVTDAATQPQAQYVPLSEGLLRIDRDAWAQWEE